MNFLIVIPKYTLKPGRYYPFPLGFAYISASLKKAGLTVFGLNLNDYEESTEEVISNAIAANKIDVVCTGGLSIHFRHVQNVLAVARRAKSDIITIVGGGIFSSEPTFMLENLDIDFGVIGEGEETIVELADAIIHANPYSSIRGIAYKNSNGEVVINPERPPIEDLSAVPFADFETFEIQKHLDFQMVNDNMIMYPVEKPRMLPVISSRSCPYDCTFCYHPTGKKYRQRSLDNFFAELDELIARYDVNIITVYDELFSVNKTRIQEFCARIKRYNIKWVTQLRVDNVDEEILEILRESGCYLLSYGLESASNVVLKSMKKQTTIEKMENALRLTRKAGIGIQGNFIFGDVAETWDTAMETLDWWEKNKQYQIILATVGVFPGSEIYNQALEAGLISDKLTFLEKGCPAINISRMTDDEFSRLLAKIGSYQTSITYNGRVLMCEKVREDYYKGEIYRLQVECPHCQTINEHKQFNVFWIQDNFLTHCQKCNQRFTVDATYFSGKIKEAFFAVYNRIAEKRVGLFGAGDFTHHRLLPILQANHLAIACIFDNNKMKHGMKLEDIDVIHFSGEVDQVKSKVDAIIISAPEFEEQIYQQIAFLEKCDIPIFRLWQ